MPDGPVVINNTPLVALWILDQFALLRDLYGEVLLPTEVETEFLAMETAPRQSALDQAPWLRVVALADPRRALVYSGLDRGEAAVLALAEERDARLVIMDERRGRQYARRLQLLLTGTLGVLLLAKEQAMLPQIAPLIQQLQAAGLYLGPELVQRVLERAGEAGEP